MLFFAIFAGLTAFSYFLPTAMAMTIAIIVGAIPFLFFFILLCFFCTIGVLVGGIPKSEEWFFDTLWNLSLFVGQKTYEGVFFAAPIIGYCLAGASLIALIFAFYSGIQASIIKSKDHLDYFEQQITEKLETYVSKLNTEATLDSVVHEVLA